jgi:hypothetical protein
MDLQWTDNPVRSCENERSVDHNETLIDQIDRSLQVQVSLLNSAGNTVSVEPARMDD